MHNFSLELLWNTTFVVLSSSCFVVGTTANTATLTYFLSRPRDIPNLLYANIAATDLALSILVLPITLVYTSRTPSWFGNKILCNMWGMAWEVFNQMSVYLVMVFNIMRTKKLLFPFERRRREPITALIAGYAVFLLLQAVFPLLSGSGYAFDNEMQVCSWDAMSQYGRHSREYKIVFVLFYLLERLLPMLVVVVCCVISRCVLAGRQLVKKEKIRISQLAVNGGERRAGSVKVRWWECLLCKHRAIKREHGKGAILERIKYRASMTVLITAMNFTILNIPNLVYLSMLAYDMIQDPDGQTPSTTNFHQNNYFKMTACVYGVVLHAMDTPLVCIWRMRDLRAYIVVRVLGVKRAALRFWECLVRMSPCSEPDTPTIVLNPNYEFREPGKINRPRGVQKQEV